MREEPSMWVLLAFSVLALTIAIERIVVQWGFLRKAYSLADGVRQACDRGAVDEARSSCERSPSALADVFLVGFGRHGRVEDDKLHRAVNRERLRVSSSLKSNLWLVASVGALSPFVGLFGTIRGIQGAMADVAKKGDEAGFAEVSGPMSIALWATAFGIFVAIVAVLLYNYFNQRNQRMAAELKLLTEEFLDGLGAPAGGDGGASEGGARGDRDAT